MKKILLPVTLTALLLAGCSAESDGVSASPDSAPSVSETASPSASVTPAPKKSARGNLIKQVGESAGAGIASGEVVLSFKVTSIEVDPTCTSPYATPPENGHFLAVHMEVETTAALAEAVNPSFFTREWGAITADGMTSNAPTDTSAAYGCMAESETLPGNFGPGERGAGTVVLDVASPSGVIVLDDTVNGRTYGWEWTY